MLREIHRYIWLSNWFMGTGKWVKKKDRQTDRHCLDFNIDVRSNQLSIINLHSFACTGLKVKSGKPKNYLKEFDE